MPRKNSTGTRESDNSGTAQSVKVLSVDAAGSKETVAAYHDGVDVYKFEYFASFDEAIRWAAQNGFGLIKVERPFANFYPGERAELIELAANLGVALMTMNPKLTPRLREKYGFLKTDKNDAVVILELPLKHFKVATVTDDEYKNRVRPIYNAYVGIRRTGRKDEVRRFVSKMVYNRVNAPKPLTNSMVAAIAFAAVNTTSRKDFTRVVGFHGNGHANILRSEMMHHGLRWGVKGGFSKTAIRREVRRVRSECVSHKSEILREFPWLRVG